jgi:hypothetical protein
MVGFREHNRGLASIHCDEQPVLLKAKVLIGEYMYFKHPFPDEIKTYGWMRKAWKRAEEVPELHFEMSPESLKYVCCQLP